MSCPWGWKVCYENEPCYLCMKSQRDGALQRARDLELLLFDLDQAVPYIPSGILGRIKKAIGGAASYTQICQCGAKITPEGHACGYWPGALGGQQA